MGGQPGTAFPKPDNECLPYCALSCVWYETNDETTTCLNRHNFVCHKHVAEVFRKTEYSGEESSITYEMTDFK